MNKNIKRYKLDKIKNMLKNHNLIFFFHSTNLDSVNKLKTEQINLKKNIKFYKAHNNSFKLIVKESVFVKFHTIAKGSLSLAFYNNPKIINNNFKDLQALNSTLILTSVKLNKKIYSQTQLNELTTLNYTKNITVFNKTLKKLLKRPYYLLRTS